MTSRRSFLRGAALAGSTLAAAAVSRVSHSALPEIVSTDKASTQPPLLPNSGQPYNPVVTLNGWTLPWRMNSGV